VGAFMGSCLGGRYARRPPILSHWSKRCGHHGHTVLSPQHFLEGARRGHSRAMMNFNDQNRPFRRRCIYARIADLSAWGGHQQAIGRSIGGAPINCAPTGYDRSWLLKFIIAQLHPSENVSGRETTLSPGTGGHKGPHSAPHHSRPLRITRPAACLI
jgi:hypothetical protein